MFSQNGVHKNRVHYFLTNYSFQKQISSLEGVVDLFSYEKK